MNDEFGHPLDERDRYELSLADLLRPRMRSRMLRGAIIGIAAAVMFGALLAAAAWSQEKDVPSSARREIAMRGEQIERIDSQVSSSGEDLIGQAAETPPDDSHKWHLTVVTVGNNRACEQLLADLADKREFRDWVNLEKHQQSWAHFKEVRYDGAVGKDWARGLEKRLGRELRVPAIVVQPPVNGEFGKHTQAVFVQEGYDGDPEKLTAAMAAAIGKYVAKVQQTRMIARGHGQESDEDRGARPPPFLVSPENPAATAGLNLPQTIIPPRVAATIDQIKSVIPEAGAEFLLAMITKQATLEEVRQAWQGEVLKRQIAELQKLRDEQAKSPAKVTPQPPAGGFSLTAVIAAVAATLIGSGGIFGLVALGLTLFRRWRQATGKPTFLSEEQFAALLRELKKLQGQQPAASDPS